MWCISWGELLHLIEAAFGNQTALQALISSIGYKTSAPITTLNSSHLVKPAGLDLFMLKSYN